MTTSQGVFSRLKSLKSPDLAVKLMNLLGVCSLGPLKNGSPAPVEDAASLEKRGFRAHASLPMKHQMKGSRPWWTLSAHVDLF